MRDIETMENEPRVEVVQDAPPNIELSRLAARQILREVGKDGSALEVLKKDAELYPSQNILN